MFYNLSVSPKFFTLNFFSQIRVNFKNFIKFIWPIKSHELPKFLSITLLMFCILGIQNLIRALKDSIVNTMIGTETISFLKFWGVMPAAFLVTLLYVKAVNYIKGENIFYLVMAIFLSFFMIFAFYILPNHEKLHLNPEQIDILVVRYANFKWFILLLSNWSFSLFYVIAELWPNIVFGLLFWQFVNMITSIEQSKRFYLLFGLFGQTGLLISGLFLKKLPTINQYLNNTFNLNMSYNIFSIQIVLIVALILGVVAIFTFWVLNHRILRVGTIESLQFKATQKQHMGLLDSIKLVLSSRYIMLITLMLICYGFAINLVELTWKASAARIYTTPTEFASFVGSYLSFTGIFTILFVILGSSIIRKLGWFATAIITPIMVFITGILFFLTGNFQSLSIFIAANIILTDPASLSIIIGAIQNVLSKSSKYTLFDSTKEMSYIPLDDELKTKGKAAADVIGTKLGKSASALLQSLVFIIVPTATFQSISLYLMIIFSTICMIWIWAVKELSKEYMIASI